MDSIELVLDESSEHFIRHEWEALLAAGLPSRASHKSPHNRPHITLAAAPVITADWDQQRGEFLTLPLANKSGGILLFHAGRKGYVLARQVVCSAALLQLHRGLHDVGRIENISSTTVPDAWVPHITLANAVQPERLPEALALLSTPMPDGQLVGARRWDSTAKTITTLA